MNVELFGNEQARPASERVLGLLLEALTQANTIYLDQHPQTPPLYRSGVVYRREESGQEEWETIPLVLTCGYGDCEDLAAWRAAELRKQGVNAACSFYFRRRGPMSIYHIVVRHPDGRIEDPSSLLGMRSAA